jgi:DNA-binding transcriptional LysR family regulator
MLNVFDSYNSMVDQMHNDKPNVLHIAFLEGIDISEYAAPIIDLLSVSHPEVIVKLDFASHTEINEGLQNKKIDVGITLLDEIIAHNNLEYAFLAKMKHGIAFHESLNLINDDELDLDKMKKEKFYITLDGSLGAKNYIKSLKQYFGLDDANFVYVPNIETQILNVEMGLGVSALSYTPRIQNNSELCFIPIDFFNMRIAAAWNKNNRSLAKKYFSKAARSYSKTRKSIK